MNYFPLTNRLTVFAHSEVRACLYTCVYDIYWKHERVEVSDQTLPKSSVTLRMHPSYPTFPEAWNCWSISVDSKIRPHPARHTQTPAASIGQYQPASKIHLFLKRPKIHSGPLRAWRRVGLGKGLFLHFALHPYLAQVCLFCFCCSSLPCRFPVKPKGRDKT